MVAEAAEALELDVAVIGETVPPEAIGPAVVELGSP